MKKFPFPAWTAHIAPVMTALIAMAMLLLTPFWAYQGYRQPFMGALIEPNNVISQISGKGWVAREAGVAWSDRLLSINGEMVSNAAERQSALMKTGFSPASFTFEKRNGERYSLILTPTTPNFGDLFTLFISPYLVGIIFLVAGLWAYRIRPDLNASRAFLTFAAAASVTTSTFLDMNTTHYVVFFWTLSLSVAGGALMNLALVFPREIPIVRRYPQLKIVPVLLVLGIGIPAALEIIVPSTPYAYIDRWILNYALIAFAIVLFIATLFIRVFRSTSAIVRQQSRIIVFGGALAFLPALLLYLLPIAFGSTVPEFRPSIYFTPMVFLPISVTYAIIRYRLLDVDKILSRALSYLLTSVVAFGVFYALIALASFLIQSAIQPNDPFVIAVYLLLLMAALNPIHNLIRRAIDRFFYRSPADYRRVLINLSQQLIVTPNLTQTLRILEDELQNAIAPERFIVYLYNDERQEYMPHASREDSAPPYIASDPLISFLRDAPDPIWLPPNRNLPDPINDSAYARLAGHTFVPLRYEGRMIGFLNLGPRRSGDLYSSEDLEFLSAVAAQSTLALENARLFTNLQHTFNQTLEMKNLMDDIFASIATGIITTDIQNKITLFNAAAEKILGIPFENLIGKPLKEALPEFYPQLATPTEKALAEGMPTLSAEVSPSIETRGDLHLRLSCSPLRDAYLATKGATIYFEDLTERRQLEADRERIRQTFGRVVAPRVRDRLLEDPSNLTLDGTEQVISLLFADISGFTSYSERHTAHEVFSLLNGFLDLAAQAVLDEEGTLDKFIGDAAMAMWNSPDPQPDHALRAVRAAYAIKQRTAALHAQLPADQHLTFHIGISTGIAMVGNVGTRELFNYTAIGDTVNIASRLEAAARSGQTLITSATYDLVRDQVIAEALDPVKVKGRDEPIHIYELKGIR